MHSKTSMGMRNVSQLFSELRSSIEGRQLRREQETAQCRVAPLLSEERWEKVDSMFTELSGVYVCRDASAVLFLLWYALGIERKVFACLFGWLKIVWCFIIFLLDQVEKRWNVRSQILAFECVVLMLRWLWVCISFSYKSCVLEELLSVGVSSIGKQEGVWLICK